jgi:hypothetical protein
MDAIPAPSASASNAILAAVLALPQRQRELLLLHVGGWNIGRSQPRCAQQTQTCFVSW